MNANIAQLRKKVSACMDMMEISHTEPRWEVFSKTYSWFQAAKKLTPEQAAAFEREWKRQEPVRLAKSSRA